MALTGRCYPLLVHFPIALVLIAAVAELVSLTNQFPQWHMVAVANIRAGAALATAEMDRPPRRLWLYRIALFSAAALVAVAGHFGALLVWGADFLRP